MKILFGLLLRQIVFHGCTSSRHATHPHQRPQLHVTVQVASCGFSMIRLGIRTFANRIYLHNSVFNKSRFLTPSWPTYTYLVFFCLGHKPHRGRHEISPPTSWTATYTPGNHQGENPPYRPHYKLTCAVLCFTILYLAVASTAHALLGPVSLQTTSFQKSAWSRK